MHSVKPGRGPSLMGGVGGIVAALFGVVWTVLVSSSGAPAPFVWFGVLFIIMGLAGAAYNFFNAASKDRMSVFDVTTHREESDPIAKALGHDPAASQQAGAGASDAGKFCPYCGTGLRAEFEFCPKCGKQMA